jgi:hypothetical protein
MPVDDVYLMIDQMPKRSSPRSTAIRSEGVRAARDVGLTIAAESVIFRQVGQVVGSSGTTSACPSCGRSDPPGTSVEAVAGVRDDDDANLAVHSGLHQRGKRISDVKELPFLGRSSVSQRVAPTVRAST